MICSGCFTYDEGLEKAVENYTQAINLNPEHPNAYYNRGLAYLKYGLRDKYELAILDFDKHIRIYPLDSAAYFNRGFAYSRLGQYWGAIMDYDESLRLNPDDQIVLAHRDEAFALSQKSSTPTPTTATP